MTEVFVLAPGQGAQQVGMGRRWAEESKAAREVIEEADRILGSELPSPLSRLMFEGPAEQLNRTDISQPAIYTCSYACYAGLREREPALDVRGAAGLSLGEYTALAIAGSCSFEQGLRIVAARGRLMQAAAEASDGGMVAIIGASDEEAEALAIAARGDGILVAANYNAPGQVVLSGSADACDRAFAEGEKRGFRASRLTVAGAFHSPLMQPAADQMSEVLSRMPLRAPSVPVWSNVTGESHDSADPELLRQRLVEQIVRPVRWAQGCLQMPAAGTIEFRELAPGSTLRGLMRRIDRERKVVSHDEP